MENKEYEAIKEHFFYQSNKNQNFYDISKLYWYQVNNGRYPVVSLAYELETDNGVELVDYKTKAKISKNVIQGFAAVFIFPNYVRCYIEDLDLPPKCFNTNIDSTSAKLDRFLVKGYYKTRPYEHAGTIREFYKFKDGVCLIRQNGNLKAINARAGNAAIKPRIMLIQTHGEEISGIVFSENILDKCVCRVKNKILVRYLKFSKSTNPTRKEENAQKTEIEHDRQM